MKNLIASIICLLILLVPWVVYDKYSADTLGSYIYIINNEIIPAVEKEDWPTAEASFGMIEKDWEKFEKISEYFLDTQTVSEADELIYETKYHIKTNDSSNAAACSAKLAHLLNYIHENECLSTGNIL